MAHPIRMSILGTLAVLLFCLPSIANGGIIPAKVIGVLDGDTIEVLINNKQYRVRLHGIDCPERRQPYSTKAKKFTSDLVFRKKVNLIKTDVDRLGRLVAYVVLPDGRELNEELVMAGYAWWYRKYAPKDDELKAAEKSARAAKRGLWADPNPVPPWEWRRGARSSPSVLYGESILDIIGRFLLISGLILFLAAPLLITISAFRNRWTYGLLCLLIPVYVYYYGVIRKSTRHNKAIITFLIGLASMIVGMILIS